MIYRGTKKMNFYGKKIKNELNDVKNSKYLGLLKSPFKNKDSYSKLLYSNDSLAYDIDSIYLIDKLELTFKVNKLDTRLNKSKMSVL